MAVKEKDTLENSSLNWIVCVCALCSAGCRVSYMLIFLEYVEMIN